jgi:ubiquinol-cytochrome c reductase cytochrome b subunit
LLAIFIKNLFFTIPYIGQYVVELLWGGFTVGLPTLTCFFSLHYLLPFVLIALIFGHLTAIHSSGSDDTIDHDDITFFPYFYVKDVFFGLILVSALVILIFFYPRLLSHWDNSIPANSLVTPVHLVPEWYFLPFYAILRSVPSKVGGLLLMLVSIVIMFDSIRRDDESEIFILGALGYLGAQPVEFPYVELTQVLALLPLLDYFFFVDTTDDTFDLFEDWSIPENWYYQQIECEDIHVGLYSLYERPMRGPIIYQVN